MITRFTDHSTFARESVAPEDASHPIKVFVAFDGDASADEAKQLISRVAPDEFCETEMCDLDKLSSPANAQAAANTAAGADLLIIAMHDGNKLTPAAGVWLSRLLSVRDTAHDRALVALLSGTDSKSETNAELLTGLEALASYSGLAFFANHARPRIAKAIPQQVR
jgi:hypothetical protein